MIATRSFPIEVQTATFGMNYSLSMCQYFLGGDYTQFELGLASQFYQKVSETATNPIFLTGHSLGGALAGFAAALYGFRCW